jgi:hypothetical protein
MPGNTTIRQGIPPHLVEARRSADSARATPASSAVTSKATTTTVPTTRLALAHPGAAIQVVADWIDDRYNGRRRHSSIGHVTPAGVTLDRLSCLWSSQHRSFLSRFAPYPT